MKKSLTKVLLPFFVVVSSSPPLSKRPNMNTKNEDWLIVIPSEGVTCHVYGTWKEVKEEINNPVLSLVHLEDMCILRKVRGSWVNYEVPKCLR